MSETAEIKIKDLAKSLSNGAKKLEDASLPNELLTGDLEEDLPFSLDRATFTVTGQAGISLFNTEDDQDGDRILGVPPGKTEVDELAPQIPFGAQRAWLRYRVGAGGKAQGGLRKAGFSFSAEAEGSVVLNSYRVHARNESLLDALKRDLARPKLIFSPADVVALEPGEAVSMHARGKLGLGVTVSWADVFSSNLSALGELLDAGEAFALKIDAGLTARLNVGIEDDYLLIFSRSTADGKLRVAVKKKERSSLAASVAAKVGVEFENPDQVEAVLGSVLEGLVGEPLDKVDEILSAASLDQLSAGRKKIAERLVDRFDLVDEQNQIGALRKKIAELRKDAKRVIRKIATTRVELGFRYEYNRLRVSNTLLQAIMDDASVARHHGGLLRGKVQAFLEAGDDGVTLERFLRERSTRIDSAWGLGLTFGKWFSISGKDVKTLDEVVRTGADGRQQISLVGARGYSGTWFGNKSRWMVDFSADMQEFSRLPGRVSADELDYALYLLFEYTEGTVAGKDLPRMLDQALVWSSVTPEEAGEESDRLGRLLARKRNVQFRFQVKLDKRAFRELLPDLASGMTGGFATALGMAMPWAEGVVRASALDRARLYGPLWLSYLENRDMNPGDLSRTARRSFREQGFPKLAAQEGRRYQNGRFPSLTIAEQARIHDDLRVRWGEFVRGMKRLERAVREKGPYEEVKKAYTGGSGGRGFRSLFPYSLTQRALGILLLERIAARPELASHVERIFTVSYKVGDKKIVENLSTSS